MYSIYVGSLPGIKPRMSIDAALADIGKLRTIEPNSILLRSVKESL